MTEFKITGPGEYMTRDGRKETVKLRDENLSDDNPFKWENGKGRTWSSYGSVTNNTFKHREDIIGPWEEPATVSSVLTYAGITKKPSDVLTWLEFVTLMSAHETCFSDFYSKIKASPFNNSPASTVEGSSNGESRSEDEAKGNTACDEVGDALKTAIIQGKCVVAATKGICSLEEETEIVKRKLEAQGFSIVRTSTLGNRNGCYNTRTDKDVD